MYEDLRGTRALLSGALGGLSSHFARVLNGAWRIARAAGQRMHGDV